MNTDKDTIRRSRAEIIAALKDAGATARGDNWKSIKCCFCPDKHPSAGIYEDAGIWRFKCHKCSFNGDVFDIRAKGSGKPVDDQLRELHDTTPAPSTPPQKVYPSIDALKSSFANLKACYVYSNPSTKAAEMIVLRLIGDDGRKKFLQARPHNGGFILKAPPHPLPIYNRTRVAAADRVVIVEGEKCVHALAEVGIVATTSPGGAGKAAYADWTPCAAKTCILWPDFDKANESTGKRKGFEHMEDVANELAKLNPPARVLWIDPQGMGLDDDGSDVVDFLATCAEMSAAEKAGAIELAIETARPVGGSESLLKLLDETIAGKNRTMATPWPHVTRLTRALRPGTILVICGDAGSGKSFLVLQLAQWLHHHDCRTALYALEEDRAYHLCRLLAQLAENSDLTDSEWVRVNPNATKAAYANHMAELDSFAPSIDAAPDEQVTYARLLEWVESRAKAGCRVIIIDPITAAATSEKPWLDDLNFLMSAKNIVRKYGASLILVTHPRKGKKAANVSVFDDLAGGAAFSRFSQTVLWLVRHEQPKKARFTGPCGYFTDDINRTVRLGKTRNGAGAGMEIGFGFDGRSLRFNEIGVIDGDGADVVDPSQSEVQS